MSDEIAPVVDELAVADAYAEAPAETLAETLADAPAEFAVADELAVAASYADAEAQVDVLAETLEGFDEVADGDDLVFDLDELEDEGALFSGVDDGAEQFDVDEVADEVQDNIVRNLQQAVTQEWSAAIASLDPEDEDFAEVYNALAASAKEVLAERIRNEVTTALVPLYEFALEQQAQQDEQQAEQVLQDAYVEINDIVTSVSGSEGLGEVDSAAVLARASELWPQIQAERGDTPEAAEATIAEATRQVAQAGPAYAPEAAAWLAQGTQYLKESVNEGSFDGRYTALLVEAAKRPDLFTPRDKPTLHAPLETQGYWSPNDDEMRVAFNWGREQAKAKGI